jgi:hypothetical protein
MHQCNQPHGSVAGSRPAGWSPNRLPRPAAGATVATHCSTLPTTEAPMPTRGRAITPEEFGDRLQRGALAPTAAELEKSLQDLPSLTRPLVVEARIDPSQYDSQF